MNKIQEEWKSASDELGFKVIIPFVLELSSGQSIMADLLVPLFGSENGTLVVSSYQVVGPYVDELKDKGFCCSILSEPGENEEFNIHDFIDVLSDWGWYGDESSRPAWLQDQQD